MFTEDGIRYRVIHDRPLIRWKQARRPDDVGKINPMGGRTIVQIVDTDGNAIVTGEARCRSDENFNRTLGRQVALGRALKALRNMEVPFT